jgi:hypothetical protein
VVVDDPENPFVEPDTTKEDSTTAIGNRNLVGLEIRPNEPIQVFDMQGRFLGKSLKLAPGNYLVREGFRLRQIRIK